ncbi:MAG: cytochrome c [Hyphomicrobiales bacterium]|nr:cytochrome c [Hyphomicrobiales bacterium]
MRRLLWALVLLAVLGAVVFYVLTAPRTLEASALPKHTPDVENGRYMYFAGGCASCHAPPASQDCADLKTEDKLNLAGGRCLKTPFGTFYVPNISPDKETGIGGWTDLQFVNAMMRGVSPSGAHYYPAFPFTSYQRMRYEDVLDLKAFIDTLKPIRSEVPDHDLALPFRLRRGLGLWKLLFLDGKQFQPDPGKSEKINRGGYLVEGPAHCGECHSPRNVLGGVVQSAKFSGGPNPEGEGYIPNITPHKNGIASWSEEDIAYSLESGFTPSFDAFGGTMTKVQENMAELTKADRAAIAAYLKSLPAIAGRAPKKKAGGETY